MTNSLAKLSEALNKAQSVMSGAKKDKKNPFFKSSYADLSAVFDAIREPFASNGLAITQTMDVLENGRTILRTRLLHSSGEFLDSKMMLPDIADPQKIGSAITYFRRYSLMSIAGIPAEDDDGNAAAKAPPPKKNQTIGVMGAKSMQEELAKFPEFQDEVHTYLSRNKLTLDQVDIDFAIKLNKRMDKLKKVTDIEEAQHG